MAAPNWLEGYFTPYVAPSGTGFFHATDGRVDAAAKLVSDGDITGPISGAKVAYDGMFFGAVSEFIGAVSTSRPQLLIMGTDSLVARAKDSSFALANGRVDFTAPNGVGMTSQQFGMFFGGGGAYASIEGTAMPWRILGGTKSYSFEWDSYSGDANCGRIRLEAQNTVASGVAGGNIELAAGVGSTGKKGQIRVRGEIRGDTSAQDPLSFGLTPITVDTTVVTLNAEQFNAMTIRVGGVFTQNTSLVFPAGVWQKMVHNAMSGPGTLTCKTATQSGGPVIPQGAVRWVYCDGTNVYGPTVA